MLRRTCSFNRLTGTPYRVANKFDRLGAIEMGISDPAIGAAVDNIIDHTGDIGQWCCAFEFGDIIRGDKELAAAVAKIVGRKGKTGKPCLSKIVCACECPGVHCRKCGDSTYAG
jgi:hypothetical protein